MSHLGTENPQAYIEKPTHPKRVTVWCGFWSRGIIGPFFFARRGRYSQWRSLSGHVERIFVPKNWRGGYWQHLLSTGRRYVEDHIISRWADVVWPSRSCDLTPLDYYLFSAVKDKCYADKPETIDALKNNIHEIIGEIQLHTIDNVLKNWTDRVGYCMARRGSHLNEIILLFSIINRKDCTFK